MSSEPRRRRPMAEVLSALNYPTSPEDNRGAAHRIAAASAGTAASVPGSGAGRGLSGSAVAGTRDAKVFFRVAGGFTFCVSFIDATLSDCRRYLILTLSVTDSELFRIGDGSQVAEFSASIPSMGCEIRTAKNEKSFDFTVKGLRFFVFPVIAAIPHSDLNSIEDPAGLPTEGEELAEADTDDDTDAQSHLADSAIPDGQKEYTGDALQAILFGDQSPRGE